MENLVNSNQAELQDHKLTAEEKLWRAVMATAIYDALHTPNVTKTMSGSVICHKCNGNGYLGNTKDERKQQDCITCKNSGEIPLTYEMIWSTLQFVTRKQ